MENNTAEWTEFKAYIKNGIIELRKEGGICLMERGEKRRESQK
jgi:hypothetical protein